MSFLVLVFLSINIKKNSGRYCFEGILRVQNVTENFIIDGTESFIED